MVTALDRVKAAEETLKKATAELNKERAARTIPCSCGAQHAISEYNLIVTHWYTRPHGCSGGDYWNEGEWNIIGPCGERSRLLFSCADVSYEERRTVGKAAEITFKHIYRHLFNSSVDEHDNNSCRGWAISRYVDQNRRKFELPLSKADIEAEAKAKAEYLEEDMDVLGAMAETVALSRRPHERPRNPSLSRDHLLEMEKQMQQHKWSYGKLCRWLGWAQAAVVASGVATLDDMKQINKRHKKRDT